MGQLSNDELGSSVYLLFFAFPLSSSSFFQSFVDSWEIDRK